MVVPRRYRWGGWTLNFGHPRAGIAGLTAMALAVGPTLLALWLFANRTTVLAVMLGSMIALVAWAHRESSRSE